MLIGRLTRDIEVRDVPNGKKVVSFTVATDEGYKGKDGQWVDKAEFTDVSYFTTEAGVNFMSSRLHKGALVYVQGRKETQTVEKTA
jgi:single-strand DNA-binding protein